MKKILIALLIALAIQIQMSKAICQSSLDKFKTANTKFQTLPPVKASWQMLKEDTLLKRKVNEILQKYPVIVAQRDTIEKAFKIADSLRIQALIKQQNCEISYNKLDTTISKSASYLGFKQLKNKDPIKDIERITKTATRANSAKKTWRIISAVSTGIVFVETSLLLILYYLK